MNPASPGRGPRKSLGSFTRRHSQPFQVLRINAAGADGPAGRLRTVAIASASHAQIQFVCPLSQLPATRWPAAGKIDLNGAKAQAPKLHQFSSGDPRCRVGQRQGACGRTDNLDDLGERRRGQRHNGRRSIVQIARERLSLTLGSPRPYDQSREMHSSPHTRRIACRPLDMQALFGKALEHRLEAVDTRLSPLGQIRAKVRIVHIDEVAQHVKLAAVMIGNQLNAANDFEPRA